VVALGTEIESRAKEVAQTVLERWVQQHPEQKGSVQSEVHRDILRTTELATFTLGRYLATGQFPTAEERDALAAPGKAPVRETIALDDLTKLYFSWRDVACERLERLAHQLNVDDAALEIAKTAARVGSDASLINLVRKFDAERKNMAADLVHNALHDGLTGLPNRTLILDRATQMLARAGREKLSVAALFIDLDNFKDINDSLGHEAGDRLLQAVAQRFEAMCRAGDTVGRMGGDEFVVLTESLQQDSGPELVAERIRVVLSQPFRIEGYDQISLVVSASIGIATGVRATADELLRDADIALYQAKAMGKDRWTAFEPAMQSAVLNRLEIERDLRSALENDEFVLLYQPVFDLDSVQACGVEALLRWRHPRRGLLAPDEFIPSLEETGLIVDVGRWVLIKACEQAALWHRRGHSLTMSVNVSMRQLEVDALIDHVRDALASSGLDPGSLILEVTETTLMRDTGATVSRLKALKELGVLVAVDDFGTGYSSLAYLRQFPVDALKIDRSFVAAMGDSAEAVALVHTLVQLGRTLGIETLAEGIEEQWQLLRLQDESCERGQGFLFSRPVDPEAIEALLSGASSMTEA
jgi:diguanylate cyclase (GGDEF)-like protein